MAKIELKQVKGYPDYSVNTDGVVFLTSEVKRLKSKAAFGWAIARLT